MGLDIKGFTKKQLVDFLDNFTDDHLIVVNGNNKSYPLRAGIQEYYKHPDLDDTFFILDPDDQDAEYIKANYQKFEAITLTEYR